VNNSQLYELPRFFIFRGIDELLSSFAFNFKLRPCVLGKLSLRPRAGVAGIAGNTGVGGTAGTSNNDDFGGGGGFDNEDDGDFGGGGGGFDDDGNFDDDAENDADGGEVGASVWSSYMCPSYISQSLTIKNPTVNHPFRPPEGAQYGPVT